MATKDTVTVEFDGQEVERPWDQSLRQMDWTAFPEGYGILLNERYQFPVDMALWRMKIDRTGYAGWLRGPGQRRDSQRPDHSPAQVQRGVLRLRLDHHGVGYVHHQFHARFAGALFDEHGPGEVAHHYNLPMFGVGGRTDSKCMDVQAGIEYAPAVNSSPTSTLWKTSRRNSGFPASPPGTACPVGSTRPHPN